MKGTIKYVRSKFFLELASLIRTQLSIGVEYTMPMLVKAQTEVYMDGNIRLQLMWEDIPVPKRLRMSFMVNTDKEYMSGFKYIIQG